MAWLPILQPRDAFEAVAASRIEFLRRYAERAEDLWRDTGLAAQRESDSPGDAPPAAPQARVNAWMRAAEIAIVTDRTGEALQFLDLARGEIMRWGSWRWPTIRVAFLGALLGDPQTLLTPAGIEFHRAGKIFATSSWNASAAVCQAAAGPLVASALASGSADRTLALLAAPGLDDAPSRLGYLAAISAMETRTLPLFGMARVATGAILADPDLARRQVFGATVAFVALHQRYADRLRLMSVDWVRWMTLKPQASLLDWTLLTIYLALLRHGLEPLVGEVTSPPGQVDEAESQLMRFLYETAQKLG